MPLDISTAAADSCLVYMTSWSLKCNKDIEIRGVPSKKTLLPCSSVYTQKINGTQIWEENQCYNHLASLVKKAAPFSAVQASAVCLPQTLSEAINFTLASVPWM